MKIPGLLLLASWVFLAALHPARCAAADGQRWALVIGIDRYESDDISELRFAAADAKAVADALGADAGYPRDHVLLMTSETTSGPDRPTNTNVLRHLDYLARKLGPDDTLTVYFSGHGYEIADKHFLATVNADPANVESLQLSSLPMELLRERLARIQARSLIFLIDACRNDPEKGKGGGDNRLSGGFARDLVVTAGAGASGSAGSAVLFACAAGERAYEWPEKGHGAFSYYLVEGLHAAKADPNGELTMASLGDYVQRHVAEWADRQAKKQTPDLHQQGAARVVLGRVTRTPTIEATGQAPVLTPGPWESLFDGTSLSGWSTEPGRHKTPAPPRGKKAPRAWRVDAGAMLGTGPSPSLYAGQQYADFELSLEYRVGARGNGGVFVRRADTTRWEDGFEIQIADDASYPQYSTVERTGAVVWCAAPERAASKPAGEWNAMTITCLRDQIRVTINGQPVTTMDLSRWTVVARNPDGSANKLAVAGNDMPRSGYVGLQAMAGQVWYRAIRIRRYR